MEEIITTELGVFLRIHPMFGTLVFSPYSGLFFAVKQGLEQDLIAFCNNLPNNLPKEIIDHLLIGYETNNTQNFAIRHYLPSNIEFSDSNELPEMPIVINWLITNKCNCNCSYCYADDVIVKYFQDVDLNEVIVKILKLNPLAVVISGGEPLLERSKLVTILQAIGNKTGIILDTNGLFLDSDIIQLLREYKVVVRISLDTLHGEMSKKLRPLKDKKKDINTLNIIIKHIIDLRENSIPVLIHTVITTLNKSNLEDLYIKLQSIGVNGWRLFSVVRPNNIEKQASFNMVMNYRNKSSLNDQNKDIKVKLEKFQKTFISKANFSIQVISTGESDKNAVVLVLPDGKFATENKFSNRKTEIDIDNIFRGVDLWGHYERYLGKS